MAQTTPNQHSAPKVVVIGAGVGGISFAIALKRQLGFHNFTIYEKTDAVGGTWQENTYPGCSSDIPVHFYSLSTDQKPDWSSSHPFQPEIQAYWDDLSKKHSLTSHLVFGHKVVEAAWDSSQCFYHITVENVKTGQQSNTSADIVISALGVLEVPRYPSIPGISDFRGELFHSARWTDTNLEGKRVAVIGNGASATQFLPIISKTPGIKVTQFCRTPNWILPPVRFYYSRAHKLACRYLPLYMRFVRFLLYSVSDISYFLIFSSSFTRGLVKRYLANYILKASPEKYHDALIPKYDLGCKRVIFDTDYLSTLHQSNVELHWGEIDSMVEDGILTKQGDRLPFDTIILATGYITDRYPLKVIGKDGQTIQDYNQSQGGPTAYLGTCVPGFPNFYMISGPNTATGHTSVLFMEEVQVNYILKLIAPIISRKILAIDVTTRATEGYNTKLQERLSRSVFVGCQSWYRVDRNGKINSIFPGTSALFWWWLRKPTWSNFQVKYVDGQERKGSKLIQSLGVSLALAAALGSWMYR